MRTAWRRVLASRVCSLLPLWPLGSLALSWAPSALAQTTTKTVVMVVAPSALPLAQRLRQEIESLGLLVKWLAADHPQRPTREQEAAPPRAVAANRIAPLGGTDVDKSIFDRATGKTVSWKLVAASATDPAAGELIATRAVELLRASLLQMAARPEPAASPPEPERAPAPLPEPPREGAQNLSFLVGPAVLDSTDFRPAAHVLSGLVAGLLEAAVPPQEWEQRLGPLAG